MTFAGLHVTKCRLCGQPRAGVEGLCSDCSRALTRARQGPAALRSAPSASARKPRGVERIVLTSPVESESARSPARGRAVLWAAMGVVAVVLVLALMGGRSPVRPAEPKVAERAARTVPILLDAPSESEPAEAAFVPAPQDHESVGAQSPSLPHESTRASVTRPTRSAASASPGARPAPDAKSGGDALRANAVAAPTPVVEPPVQQAQARTSAAPSTASGDDAQALASALENCSGEKFLAGVICEQKVRLRYCEGKWGQVPQCTPKPRVD